MPVESSKWSRFREAAQSWSGLGTLVVGASGFLFGAGVLVYARDSDAASKSFSHTTSFYLWLLLIAGQTALWFLVAAPLWFSLKGRPRGWSVWAKLAVFAAILVGIYFATSYGEPPASPLALHRWKMGLINFIGVSVALLAVFGIWTTQVSLEKLYKYIKGEGAFGTRGLEAGASGTIPASAAEGDGRPDGLKAFIGLRADMERYLLAAGVIIGAATLATGGLMGALRAVSDKPDAPFPREIVIGYGLFCSGMLALVYAPAYVWLVKVRSLLRDKLAPLPAGEPKSWPEWGAKRKAVDELLQVQAGVASFAGGVSILTPLLGSLISVLIGK